MGDAGPGDLGLRAFGLDCLLRQHLPARLLKKQSAKYPKVPVIPAAIYCAPIALLHFVPGSPEFVPITATPKNWRKRMVVFAF
jgi:hypothetical protein